MSESRTIKSLKNAEVSVIYYTLSLIVGFWSRKVFYDYLGSEVLGLDTTASSLLGFLNLAELGVGTAVGYFLYQPMFDKDTLKMNEIVALQGWIYRRVASIIIVAACILMCFFPHIFNNIGIPSYYPYITFLAMLFNSLLGYFFNYRQCILAADQSNYKVTRVTSGANLGLKIILIIILPYVAHPFFFYIGTTILGGIIGCIWLNHVLRTDYPWLHKTALTGRQLLKKYPEILKKTGQLFFHKITTMIVFKLAPLIMYAFTTLTQVAYYGNYLTLVDNTRAILGMAFDSTAAGIGNLIASHDHQRIMEVFWELTDSRLCISTACLLVVGLFAEPFISVWLSPNYLLGSVVLFLIVFNAWLMVNRTTVDAYINGFGLYQDIWAPVVEGIINLSCSVALGYLYGIAGVLAGGIISTIIIVYLWKPYFLYTRGLRERPVRLYFVPMLLRWILIIANIAVFAALNKILAPSTFQNFRQLFAYFAVLCIAIIPITYFEFYLFTPGTRRFHRRIWGLVNAKINKP